MLDAEAIIKAYPEVNQVTETQAFTQGCVDVTTTLDQTKIDAARVELDKLKYQTERVKGSTSYASFGDQLDMLYKDIVAGKLDTTGTWATHIKAVKDANPKP